ncbi:MULTISPECIES: SusC/RagA family TonB-linked outer membrane protein [Chryseobacterium]|uniref:Outer membrane receptor FepA n=1 Tax=Chryseobacterium taihuense TaxID=1141221 RepID=A0A4U8W8R4_9FLAO|nr:MULTISPECIES: SusC/RagA family TonB-linked outer membrane protein [Chryseobacterium]QQV04114.1 SusC/RagA family TonB-linked outer membrane protein [Chryseobacterium sp. FDAARGOS 1104]VFB02522.1 outer membrane receptor FepA [Chryseobacterium taihuense]
MKNFTTVLKIAPAFLLASSILHAQNNDSLTKEKAIEEVVLVGFGAKKKSDLTGSVTAVTEKDFNKGAIVSADQLIQGKAPGVRITNNGGSPDSNPNIRIRGGSSLSASNNPLIVIDGIPLDATNPAGIQNPLALVNPNDIESFSILKDASATAIYGARASNGVILIKTKSGGGKLKMSFNTNVSVGKVSKYIDVMDSDQFVDFVKNYFPNDVWKLGVGGDINNPTVMGRIYDTNWQDVVYRTSVSTDNNFSASGNLFNRLPVRLSLGYNRTEGVVRNDDLERYSAALRLTPTFFDKHLKIDVNAKGFKVDKQTVDAGGAIGSALSRNPTLPIYSSDVWGMNGPNYFGGYYQNYYIGTNGRYNLTTDSNPLGLLEQRFRPENTMRFLGNVELDYKFHFLPDLRAVVNMGIESSRTKIRETYAPNARNSVINLVYNSLDDILYNPGLGYAENQFTNNRNLDAYLVYNRKINDFFTNFLIQGGYTYQDFKYDGNKEQFYADPGGSGIRIPQPNRANPTFGYFNHLNLQSFFARTNVDIKNRYLFTASFRADASSLFNGFDNQWGYFPSAAVAWKMQEEEFLRNSSVFKELKLRLGWGQTGQQDITQITGGFYPSRPLFSLGTETAQYLPGFNIYNALPFNQNLKWETTTSWNAGLDFSLFRNNLISGSIDFYDRKSTDLLLKAPLPPGQGLTNEFSDNVGSLRNRGVEMNLNVNPIKNENLNWNIFGNFSYNKGEILELKYYDRISAGGDLPVGTGVKVAYNVVGLQPYSAWVFQQVYDASGNPIADSFVDRNGDGIITNEDRYDAQMIPNFTYGFGTSLTYKNWDFTANLRGQIGGKVYDGRHVAQGFVNQTKPSNSEHLNNTLDFSNNQYSINLVQPTDNMFFSDYFLHDASFLRMDNVTLGYKIDKVFGNKLDLRIYGSVNNAFIITNYKGQDPENFGGIDSNFYPRPRIYTLGFNFNF